MRGAPAGFVAPCIVPSSRSLASSPAISIATPITSSGARQNRRPAAHRRRDAPQQFRHSVPVREREHKAVAGPSAAPWLRKISFAPSCLLSRRSLLLGAGLLLRGPSSSSLAAGLGARAHAAMEDDVLKRLDALITDEPRDGRLRFIRGSERFRRCLIADSIADFDDGIALQPERLPYAWQRGISLYYAGRFDEGKEQFEIDMTANGSDVEETVWRFLCMARLGKGAAKAEEEIIKIRGDPRPVMSQVYSMFASGSPAPEQLVARAQLQGDVKTRFYANLYAGLYSEAKGQPEEARRYILAAAAATEMAQDYMWDVARVHAAVRGWA